MRKALWLLALVFVVGCGSGKKPAAPVVDTKDAQPVNDAQANPNVSAVTQIGVTAETRPMVEQATQLILKREFGKAFDQLNAAIKADSKCSAAYFMRAGIFADAGQDSRAVADFSNAIALEPQNSEFYNARGFYYLTRQKHDLAVKDFSVALKFNSIHGQARNNRGLSYVALGQFKPAIVDFTEALKINPKNFDTYNNRGFAYFRAGDSDHALRDFDSALRLDENCLNAYNNKGLVHFKAEQYDLAIEDFTQAIQHDRLNAKYYRHRRESYLKAGRDEEARGDLAKITWLQELARLSQIAQRAPKDAEAWIQRGLHLVKGDEFEVATKDFQNALKIDEKSAGAHLGLAEMNLKQDKTKEALAECELASKLGAASAAASLQGDIYLKLNQFDAAIAAFEDAQRFDATVAEAYLLRSKDRQSKGQTQQADADYRQAVALDPSLEGTRQ